MFEGTDACVAGSSRSARRPSTRTWRRAGTFVEKDGIVQPQPAPRFSRTRRHPDPAARAAAGADTREALTAWGDRRRRRPDRARRRRPGLGAEREAVPVPRHPRRGRRRRRRVRRGAALRRPRRARRTPGPARARRARRRSTSTTGPGSCSAAARSTSATRERASRRAQHRVEAELRELAAAGRRGGLPVPRRLLRHRHARHAAPAASSTGRTPSRSAPCAITLTDGRRARTRCSARCRTPSTPSSATRRRSPGCPRGAVLLASSATCPVQAFRLGAQRLRHPVPPRARRRRPRARASRSTATTATSTRREVEVVLARAAPPWSPSRPGCSPPSPALRGELAHAVTGRNLAPAPQVLGGRP